MRDFVVIERDTDDGMFRWYPDKEWYLERGVYGGLTAAAIVRCIGLVSAFPIRRLTVDMCAPVGARLCMVDVTPMRIGRTTAFYQVTLTQDGQCVSLAQVACGATRSNGLDRARKHVLPQPEFQALPYANQMPPFAQFFEYQPCLGHPPMSGNSGHELLTGGWIRPRFEAPLDEALTAAIIDAWWPALFTATTSPRPMGTLSLCCDFVKKPTALEDPYYLTATTREVADGYAIEVNELWSKDGYLLCAAQQNVVLIK